MNVYLIRHAQSEENTLNLRQQVSRADFNRIVGQSALSPITPHGRAQAEAVAISFNGIPIDRLYSSPFLRALQTAEIIGGRFSLAPIVLADLREILPRTMPEQRSARSLRRLFIQSYLEMLLPGQGSPQGEGWREAYTRVKRAFAAITEEPAENVVAVAHRGTIGLILWGLRRSPQWRVLSRDLSNTGVSLVQRVDHRADDEPFG
ncbi:histidine phosphatase family protein [Candidatus Gracilibacteria bacterium]|nr:histidine phosphatase family protein [Candidatus Gracilibacteria bacterium]